MKFQPLLSMNLKIHKNVINVDIFLSFNPVQYDMNLKSEKINCHNFFLINVLDYLKFNISLWKSFVSCLSVCFWSIFSPQTRFLGPKFYTHKLQKTPLNWQNVYRFASHLNNFSSDRMFFNTDVVGDVCENMRSVDCEEFASFQNFFPQYILCEASNNLPLFRKVFIGPRYTWGPIYGSECL